jgi:endonuclease/exonuclease/phosphatase family metal-dependent hydrolase
MAIRIILLALVCSCFLTPAATAAPADSNALCVVTFNLRFASPKPPNSWPERRPVTRDCILHMAPDLMGTQEGVYAQIKDLAQDLPEYDWIGLGRNGGSRSEFMAVFYRKQRFEPLEFDHFWLSDAPELIASSSWGNRNRRMVTWVKFLDRQTRREFYFFNTHFDHEMPEARERAARLIRQRIEALQTTLPVILVGDFNAPAGGNPVYDTLVGGELFTDTWHSARERRGEVIGTFHGYKEPVPEGVRIDWILTRGKVTALATEVVNFSKNNQYPSDHFPVAAWLQFE